MANIAYSQRSSTFKRVAVYITGRLVMMFATVVIGVFLTILIANMGGYVDEIQRGIIREDVSQAANQNLSLRSLTSEERMHWVNEQIILREKQLGLDKPFMVRAVKFMKDALTLNLGRAQRMTSDKGSQMVRDIILERLPPTLILFGISGLLLFVVEIWIALGLSRHYGGFWDKLFVFLAPASTSPAWFYGIFLILIFAAMLGILPFGGMMDAPVPDNWVDYTLSLLRHMILPLVAVTLSQIFLNTYNWRTFFLIYSNEDYVEMAKAKGLPSRVIEREYIMRPTLPTIITSFALTLIGLWQGFIIMETVFNWPGMGRAYFQAVQFFDVPVIVGMTVINAYMLAITMFILDFIYAILDPRVQVANQGGNQ
ncbi:MAG: ABC transporter permease [Anaerolineaceae bacterium]|nr:ABC transporter permease [Anaerolineaceae bacterium]